MNKTVGVIFVSTLVAASWAAPSSVAQVGAGPQMPGPSQILDLPTGPTSPAPAKSKPPAVALPTQPEDLLRDPFWPIGYMPPKAQVDTGPALPTEPDAPALPDRNWEQAQKALSIKGIIKSGSSYLANINNQILGANDHVSIYYDSQKYVWKITSISAKSVQFQPDLAATAEPPKSE